MNFNSILIGSDNPQRLVEYYTRLFGEPQMADESYSGWQFGSGFVNIGHHSEVSGRNPQPGRFIWNIETDDVRGEFDRLVAAGATVVQEPYSPGGADEFPDFLIATLSDPDDNYFQLMSPMPPDAMGG